ncbi:MAG: hypothetical protein F6J87_19600 [Spirulina sp. SIO3F2]|nr:hypothetical protein [Spirulina sp. SIO3F2]
MSTQNQARAMMMRHTKSVRNRQESMLGRTAAEIGLDINPVDFRNSVQGKPSAAARRSYDRSASAMS